MKEMKNSELQLFAESEAQTAGAEAADAGQENSAAQSEGSAARMSWKEIMADAEYRKEYDAQVQNIVQKRLKGRHEAESRLQSLEPVLQAVSKRFCGGNEITASGAEALAQEIMHGNGREQGRKAREHLQNLKNQERAMQEKYPGFDLEEELENERFVRLTAPHSGLSLEDAYCAVHYAQMIENEAKRSLRAVTEAVRAGRSRPHENAGNQSASMIASDPKAMNREQRQALRKRIYDAKAQGKKLPYGG